MLFDAIRDVDGLENVVTQVDDPVVEKVVEKIGQLRSFRNRNGNYRAWFKNKDTLKLINELDAILTERFGIKFLHIATDFQGIFNYAIFAISGTRNSALNHDLEEGLEELDKYLGDDTSGAQFDEHHRVYNEKRALHHYQKMSQMMEENLYSGIEVDWEKAKLNNVSSKLNFSVLADFTTIFNTKGMTDRMITAVLFHEIGHAFTHIAYANKMARETIQFVEIVKEGAASKDYKRKIVIEGKKRGKDLEKKNEVVATYELFYGMVEEEVNAKYNNHSYTNSEHEADVFAARFGLGGDLGKGLGIIYNKYGFTWGIGMFLINMIIHAALFSFFVLLQSLSIFVSAYIFFYFILANIIYLLIMILIVPMIMGGADSNKTTYDSPKDRIRAIRLDIIRQMRMFDIPKDKQREYLSQIDTLNRTVNSLWSNITDVTGAIGDRMPWKKGAFDFQRMEKLIEEVSENDLHLSAAKINVLT